MAMLPNLLWPPIPFHIVAAMNGAILPTFLSNKWQRPGKHIHEIWKPVWMRGAVELSDIHNIVLIFQYCS